MYRLARSAGRDCRRVYATPKRALNWVTKLTFATPSGVCTGSPGDSVLRRTPSLPIGMAPGRSAATFSPLASVCASWRHAEASEHMSTVGARIPSGSGAPRAPQTSGVAFTANFEAGCQGERQPEFSAPGDFGTVGKLLEIRFAGGLHGASGTIRRHLPPPAVRYAAGTRLDRENLP